MCIAAAAAAAKLLLQSCPTLCDPVDGSPPARLPRPRDSPGKSTGVGVHRNSICYSQDMEAI